MREEDLEMENRRSSSRSAPSAPKSNGGDKTNKQDSSPGNLRFGRNARKREPLSTPKQRQNDTNFRKPTPQKNKTIIDKRPRNRGYYSSSCNTERNSEEVTTVSRVEPGSALGIGSKKANLNHLLNFTIAPRDGNNPVQSSSSWSNSGWKPRNRWSSGSKRHHKYNKEQFLQASCQFLVSPSGDYTVHGSDPDMLVDWDLIEQIRIYSHEIPSCPICLFPPTAAKITRCGHIYCWSCMLHYLALSDKTWRKCPICYEAVHKKDLKSVVAYETKSYSVGDEITMLLMKRVRGSVYAEPVSMDYCQDHADRDNRLNKLVIANPSDIQFILENEKRELNTQLLEEAPENVFVEEALSLLRHREGSINSMHVLSKNMEELLAVSESNENKINDIEFGITLGASAPSPVSNLVVSYSSAFDDECTMIRHEQSVYSEFQAKENDSTSAPSSLVSLPNSYRQSEARSVNAFSEIPAEILTEIAEGPESHSHSSLDGSKNHCKDIFYFYQAKDGQHMYLHSINVRCLLREYGSLEHCPATISAKILEMEAYSMTEELRRRLRYLSHLPVTGEFQVTELQLQPPVISHETLKFFIGDIQKRAHVRRKRRREEQQWNKYAEQEENKKIGRYPRARISLKSYRDFPQYSNESVLAEYPIVNLNSELHRSQSPVTSEASSTATNDGQPASGSPPTNMLDISSSENCFPSFAQMLKLGKATSVEPRKASRIVTSSAVVGDNSDDENTAVVPDYHNTLSTAFDAAFQALDNKMDSGASEAMTGQKKKKGKGKKKILFSTSVARAK